MKKIFFIFFIVVTSLLGWSNLTLAQECDGGSGLTCPAGQICSSASANVPGICINNGTCFNQADCGGPGSGSVCIGANLINLQPGTCTPGCYQNSDCPNPQTCTGGSTAPPRLGQCGVINCQNNLNCPFNQFCGPNGSCVALPPGGCYSNALCTAPQTCIGGDLIAGTVGNCGQVCQNNFDCTFDNINSFCSNNGTCSPLPPGTCYGNGQCTDPETCVGGDLIAGTVGACSDDYGGGSSGGTPSQPAQKCDESGDGINLGTAVNINFRNGLVPCGNNGRTTYIATVKCNAPSSTTICTYDDTQASSFQDARTKALAKTNCSWTCPRTPAVSIKEIVKLTCRCELYHVFILILNIYHFIIRYIAIPIAVVLIVIGGVLILLSGANQNWYNTGRHMVFWAISAVLLILLAWVIVNILMMALGYSGAWSTFPI